MADQHDETETLHILCCTCNVGNAPPTTRDIQAWIPVKGSLPVADSPMDVIVIGMQEATWKTHNSSKKKEEEEGVMQDDTEFDSDEEDEENLISSPKKHDIQSKLAALNVEDKEGVSPSRSPKGKDGNSSDTLYLRQELHDTLGDQYRLLKEYQRGQMRLYVFVLHKLASKVMDLEVKAENTGIAGVYHNKGGILVQFCIGQTRLTFLSAHLAAHEGKYKTRNDHLREILKGARPNPKHLAGLDAALASHHMFVMGDLNYRARIEAEDVAAAKDDADAAHEAKVNRALELIRAGDFAGLYARDELSDGLRKREVLCGFQTPPCHFSPTFKLLRQEGFHYKSQRVPSYTDRVLYTSAAGLSDRLRNLSYEPCPGFASSDHKPIRGAFAVQLNNGPSRDGGDVLTEPISLVVRDIRCSDLPAMDVDGSSDPYVMFVCDPPDLIKDDRHPREQKKRSDKSKWPRTPYKQKTLHPSWEESVSLAIPPDASSQMRGAMLWLQVMDYDAATADDTMGSLALNVRDLVSIPDDDSSCKTVCIDGRPLLKYGREQGTLSCRIDVRRGGIAHATAREAAHKKHGFFSGLTRHRNPGS